MIPIYSTTILYDSLAVLVKALEYLQVDDHPCFFTFRSGWHEQNTAYLRGHPTLYKQKLQHLSTTFNRHLNHFYKQQIDLLLFGFNSSIHGIQSVYYVTLFTFDPYITVVTYATGFRKIKHSISHLTPKILILWQKQNSVQHKSTLQ